MHKHPSTSRPLGTEPPSRPFLKWTGGKQRLLPQLLPLLPPGRRLIEPFVGAGSVLLASCYPRFVINDANPDLAAVWLALKERPREYIEAASRYFTARNHCAEAYVQLRTEFNSLVDSFERAVRVPYLNKFGFNGLCRVNKQGQFNVPYGKPVRLPTFPRDAMVAATKRLTHSTVMAGDFSQALEVAEDGDVVYCDPPYSPLDGAASFTAYTREGFSESQHVRLVAAARQAAARGATVLISNHDTRGTRELYCGLEIIELRVRRSVSADSGRRTTVPELVAILRPAPSP